MGRMGIVIRLDIIIKNGLLVDPANGLHTVTDIGVKDGKVVAVSPGLGGTNNCIDAEGLLVTPGCIDMHTHCTLDDGYSSYYMIASSGVTTTIDFAGPPQSIYEKMLAKKTFGLNVGTIEAVAANEREGHNLSEHTVDVILEKAMQNGALGLKLLGGHFPLTPKATAYVIELCNRHKVMVGVHSGTTEHRSDIMGMRESVELCGDNAMVLAHINAYCRGRIKPYLQELGEAFGMLRDHPRIFADSHLATINGTFGTVRNGRLHDAITENCLDTFGYDKTPAGLERAMRDGLVLVQKPTEQETLLLERDEGVAYWKSKKTETMISFPANLATTATVCALERRTPGGEFLIPMTATDGGSIPRNDLIFRVLNLYHMGYMSLEDVVRKISLNPARVFALTNKGHLGVGADADITLINLPLRQPVMSFAKGKVIMKDGKALEVEGTMLVSESAVAGLRKKSGVAYEVIDTTLSLLYQQALS